MRTNKCKCIMGGIQTGEEKKLSTELVFAC